VNALAPLLLALAGGQGGAGAVAERQLLQQAGSRVVLLSLEGPLSFGASRYLTQLLNDSDVYACLVLDLSAVSHLGVTASLAIDALCRDASQQGRRVLIAAPQPRYRDRLTRFGIARYGGGWTSAPAAPLRWNWRSSAAR